MKIHYRAPAPDTANIGTGWQPAGAPCQPTQVTNSTFTPSRPSDSRNIFPGNETRFWPLALSDSWDASTDPQVNPAPEQTSAPLEFRQLTDAVHKTTSRSRLRRFINHLFHPGKYLALRKAEKVLENIKGMLAAPTIFMIDGRYDALNKGLLSDFAQFIAAGKTLQPKQKLDGTGDDYTTQCRALGTLLMENTPVEMLLDETLTEGWRTVLPAFAEFAKDFRLRVAPCIGLTAKFMEAIQLNPGEFLSECIPDWSIRFDEKATTAMKNAPERLLPRLEAYLNKAKQHVQALDNSRVIHF